MKKSNGYYMASYLKNNWLVLVCELAIVLLLALICTVVVGGQPAWLTPAMAVTAYLLAELRFMMAYVATVASKAEKENREELESDELPPEGTEQEDDVQPSEPVETEEERAAREAQEAREARRARRAEEARKWASLVDEDAQDGAMIEPAKPDVQVDAARVDEPDAEDSFVISEEEADLPTSKTLELDEDK
ncbi:MAG: hypothetical protein E7625_03130 [Ruminococcaceae bacterium]|nr:hypothetical protein [Oscillospiraceae bacterium]